MTITYCRNDPVSGRWSGVGRLLTEFEVDFNFYQHDTRITTLEGNAHTTVSIDTITQPTPDTILFTMTDATTRGPFTIPSEAFVDRGTWATSTAYAVNDTFQINGTVYRVLFAHTSSATSFDPAANDGLGHNYYSAMLTIPGNSLPTGGATAQVLQKSSSADYAVTWSFVSAVHVTFAASTASGLVSTNVSDALEEVEANIIKTLSGLSDVSVTESSGIDGYTLNWNNTAGKWEAVAPSGGGGSLASDSDVTITSPQQFDNLQYDGTKWVNKQLGSNNFGTTSGSHALDPAAFSEYVIKPNGAVTFTCSTAAIPGTLLLLQITDNGPTSYVVTFGSGIISPYGSVNSGVSSGNRYVLFSVDAGGNMIEIARSSSTVPVLTLTGTGTESVDPEVSDVYTTTISGANTLNCATANFGKRLTIVINTSGTSSFNVTFGTNFKSQGTLATGTVSGKTFTVTFVGDGTNMNEISRTAAM